MSTTITIDQKNLDAEALIEAITSETDEEQLQALVIYLFGLMEEEKQFEALEEMLSEDTKQALAESWLESE